MADEGNLRKSAEKTLGRPISEEEFTAIKVAHNDIGQGIIWESKILMGYSQKIQIQL